MLTGELVASNAWSQVQAQGALPPRRSGALGVMHEHRMFLFGGYDGRDGNYFNDLFYFNFGAFVYRCQVESISMKTNY